MKWVVSASMAILLACAAPLRAADAIPTIFVNEVLSNSENPLQDAIELYNPTNDAVDVTGWYLTDDRSEPTKYKLPPGSVIGPNNYIVILHDQFVVSFGISQLGDKVFVFSADAAGNLTGYSNGYSFEGADLNVSFGRYINSVGSEFFVAQAERTFGVANSGPKIGPVVINEIMYDPVTGNDEYVELLNITPDPVKLYDPSNPANTWRVAGIGFDFPQNVEIAGKGLMLLVPIDPAVFRAKYKVPDTVPILGPFLGTLNNNSDALAIFKPGVPVTDPTTGQTTVPQILVDSVTYTNQFPWPLEPAGQGPSLERINPESFGNDPGNWRASGPAGTPGGSPGIPPDAGLDTDHDGIPDLMDTDDDNDGFPDGAEMTAGTNPLDPLSFPGGSADFDSDGILDDMDPDDDNDGVSDHNELSDGTNPYKATSFVKKGIVIKKLVGTVRFTTPGTGTCLVMGTVPGLAPGFNPDQAQVKVNVGGVVLPFILNKAGSGKAATATFSLKVKRVRNRLTGQFEFVGGDVPFRLVLKKGPYLTAWAPLGVDPTATKTEVPFEMPVQFNFFGRVFSTTALCTYTATALKGGKFLTPPP